jgi:uncharacterized protein
MSAEVGRLTASRRATRAVLEFVDPLSELDVSLPIARCAGQAGAPRVWVQAGLHGDEVDGMLAVARILRRLDEVPFTGSLTLVPVVNLPAARAGTGSSPVDGKNLNRAFPGGADGSWSQRFAAWLLDQMVQSCDVVIDLHGGGQTTEVDPFCFYFADGASSALSRGLAGATGAKQVFPLPPSFGGTLCESLDRAKIPSVLLEAGQGPSWSEDAVCAHVDSVLSLLGRVEDVLAAPVEPSDGKAAPEPGGRTQALTARVGGIVSQRIRAGLVVEPGQPLLRMTDGWGDLSEEIRSPGRAHVLSVSTRGLVAAGGFCVLLGRLTDGKGR